MRGLNPKPVTMVVCAGTIYLLVWGNWSRILLGTDVSSGCSDIPSIPCGTHPKCSVMGRPSESPHQWYNAARLNVPDVRSRHMMAFTTLCLAEQCIRLGKYPLHHSRFCGTNLVKNFHNTCMLKQTIDGISCSRSMYPLATTTSLLLGDTYSLPEPCEVA